MQRKGWPQGGVGIGICLAMLVLHRLIQMVHVFAWAKDAEKMISILSLNNDFDLVVIFQLI